MMFPLGLALAVVPACGDDDDDKHDATVAAADGGSSVTNPEGPGITAKDCPSAPSNLSIVKVAPVWNGLIVIEASVERGTPESFEWQIWDPALGEFRQFYAGGTAQKPDGRFVFSVSPSVRESTKTAELKVRTRTRLTGCPPSAWAESPGFTLGDPITGTTWRLDLGPSQLSGNIYVNHSGPAVVTSTGPYSFQDQPSSHTIAFNADGSFAETYQFTITSKTVGDLYKDCTFQLSFVGKWQLRWVNDSPSILITERKPKTGAATTGSTCSAPALTELAINQPTAAFEIPSMNTGLGIDYTLLRTNPPGKATWSANFGTGFNGTIFDAIADTVGADTSNANGNAYPQYALYERQ